MDNRTFESVSLLSINNLLLIAALAAAVLGGWFKLSAITALFPDAVDLAVVAVAVLSSSPIIATRHQGLAFRRGHLHDLPVADHAADEPTILLIWANAGLLFYLAFREGLIAL